MFKEVSEEVLQVHEDHQQHRKDYVEPPPVPLLELGELKRWSFYRAVIAKFVATLLFLYVTVATVIGHEKGDAQCDGVGVLSIAWAFGGMIFVLVYCTAGISLFTALFFLLVYTVFSATGAKRSARDSHVPFTWPPCLLLGLGHWDQVINPARSFAAAVIYNDDRVWDYQSGYSGLDHLLELW